MSQSKYEVIGNLSTLPPPLQQQIMAVQDSCGLTVVQDEGATYAILHAGEKRTGGYSIDVQSVTETAKRILLTVRLNKPKTGTIVIQAITYPTVVVKFPRTEKAVELTSDSRLC
jgi:hypothetical protein